MKKLLISVSLMAMACGDQAGGASSAAPSAKASTAPKASATASTGSAPTAAASAAPATGAKVASCTLIKQESLCVEYGEKNIEAAGMEMLKGICDTKKGEFKEVACASEKRVGTCATPEGTKSYYADGIMPWDAKKAEAACKEAIPAGEWKAGS